MHPILDPHLATARHRELLAEREQDRVVTRVRRLAKARRLGRRADGLARRAARLVEQTHA